VAKCTDCVTAVVGGGGAVGGYSTVFLFFYVAPNLFGARSRNCRVTIANIELTILGHSQSTAYFHNSNFSNSIHFAFWRFCPKFYLCPKALLGHMYREISFSM
jgi:hypothetical protein